MRNEDPMQYGDPRDRLLYGSDPLQSPYSTMRHGDPMRYGDPHKHEIHTWGSGLFPGLHPFYSVTALSNREVYRQEDLSYVINTRNSPDAVLDDVKGRLQLLVAAISDTVDGKAEWEAFQDLEEAFDKLPSLFQRRAGARAAWSFIPTPHELLFPQPAFELKSILVKPTVGCGSSDMLRDEGRLDQDVQASDDDRFKLPASDVPDSDPSDTEDLNDRVFSFVSTKRKTTSAPSSAGSGNSRGSSSSVSRRFDSLDISDNRSRRHSGDISQSRVKRRGRRHSEPSSRSTHLPLHWMIEDDFHWEEGYWRCRSEECVAANSKPGRKREYGVWKAVTKGVTRHIKSRMMEHAVRHHSAALNVHPPAALDGHQTGIPVECPAQDTLLNDINILAPAAIKQYEERDRLIYLFTPPCPFGELPSHEEGECTFAHDSFESIFGRSMTAPCPMYAGDGGNKCPFGWKCTLRHVRSEKEEDLEADRLNKLADFEAESEANSRRIQTIGKPSRYSLSCHVTQ